MSFSESPIVYLTKLFWKFSEGNRKKVIIFSILYLIANMIIFLDPLIVGWLLNTIQEEGVTNLTKIFFIISLFVLTKVGFWAFHGPGRVLETENAFGVRANFRKYLVDGVMALPLSWHTDHHSGDSIDKIEKATSALYDYSRTLFEIAEPVIRFLSSYVALIVFNFHSSYIVLFFIIIGVKSALSFDKKLIPQYKKLFRAENVVAAKVYDAISNITTTVILKIEKMLSIDIWQKIMAPFPLYKKNTRINEWKWFSVSLISALMMFFVVGSYIFFNAKSGSTILIGNVYILYGYVERINGTVFRFTFKYSRIVRYKSQVENVKPITEHFRKKQKVKPFKLKKWKKLIINNLSFSYHDKEHNDLHLNNVNVVINRKEKIALVGESGSGKTTFLKLIRGLYKPKKLDLYVDNKKVKGNFNAIEDDIALIPQEPELFATTIKNNITLGLHYNRRTLDNVVNQAAFNKVVKRLPNGYESSIMEKGVNLSGGEKQRLALARGILASKHKEIILFDEPTSSVDSRNEMRIYKNLFEKNKSKTIISSIHRLHLLKLFDRVFYFKAGKLVATGTFNEMLKNKDFKKLWDKYKTEK